MCGISGFIGFQGRNISSVKEIASKMSDTISHRGPDDSGIWYETVSEIMLSHRRLSIQDLSVAGKQPMISSSGRFVIVFNGEIYNHLNLRSELQRTHISSSGLKWQGNSDTETLINCIEMWGLKKTLEKVIGMFAFSLFDRKDKEFYLVRDRMGEKPLYYGYQRGTFLFGSEIKALQPHPAFEAVVNRDAIIQQLRLSYIPSPNSIYRGIKKLPPGTFLKLKVRECLSKENYLPEPTIYWSLANSFGRGNKKPFEGSRAEAVIALEKLLLDSVNKQMLSDVPIGAFLSGGIDSSLVTSLMQTQSIKPIKTFSIGFNDFRYNEAKYAKAVAHYLGTDHQELYVTSKQALDSIPRLPELYDEPFSDSSQIPTYLVSEMTGHHVKVALSGDAGDELFGGYNRYIFAANFWDKISKFPFLSRKLARNFISAFSSHNLNRLAEITYGLIPKRWRISNFGEKLQKFAGVLECRNLDEVYLNLVSHWDEPNKLVIGGNQPETLFSKDYAEQSKLIGIERMLFMDAMTYLPDDILVKVDRASMGVSLETRVPFLDHRVVDFSNRLPLSFKIRNGQGKWILREILNKYVPREIIERPKMGFAVPIDRFLKCSLRDWAENLLNETRLKNEGFFHPKLIRERWHEHISGKRNWQYHLWDVLMFQAWLEKQKQ